MQKLTINFEGQSVGERFEKLLFCLAQLFLVHLGGLFNKAEPEEDLGPHDVVHGSVNFLFSGELFGPVKNLLKLHDQRAA